MTLLALLAIPLLLFTVLGTAAAAVIAGYALLKGKPLRAKRISLLTLGWLGAYTILLIVVSLVSDERRLAPGEEKRFCGFYLDCHLAVSVDGVDTAKTLAVAGRELTAAGTFHVVTLRISSNARRITMHLWEPNVVVVDGAGRTHERSMEGEQALPGPDASPPLTREVSAGAHFTRRLVFDLPSDVRDPALLVTQGHPVDRATELVLIGDEDSLLHEKTLLRLDASAPAEARATAHAGM